MYSMPSILTSKCVLQLDVEELVDLAGNLGVELTEQDGERAFSVLDANGSGMVDFDEFFAFYGAHLLVHASLLVCCSLPCDAVHAHLCADRVMC